MRSAVSEAVGPDLEEANPAALYLNALGTDASKRGMISPLNHAARLERFNK
jgi:hypothetical protein